MVSFCSRGRGGGKEAHLEEIQGRPKGDRRAHARPDRLRLRQVDDLLRVLGARSYLLRQVHGGQVAHVVHVVEPGLHQRPPQARRARHEVSVQAGRQHHSRALLDRGPSIDRDLMTASVAAPSSSLARFFFDSIDFSIQKSLFFFVRRNPGNPGGYRIRFLKWKIKYARAVLANKGFLLEAG